MMDWKANSVTVGAIALLILIMLGSSLMFGSKFQAPKIIYVEEPLTKNSEFGLVPGEVYRYSVNYGNASGNVTYAILRGQGCVGIRVLESVNSSGTCVKRDGTDRTGYNSTLADPSIMMFKPWMLALGEGWHWNASAYIYYGMKEERVSETYYRVIRMEDYNGRQSFLVGVRNGDGPEAYEWIDAEKRILMKMSSNGYEIALAEEKKA